MEVFSAPRILQSVDTGLQLTIWDAKSLQRLGPLDRGPLKSILDALGRNSAQAQGLRASITSFEKLLNADHRLYLATAGNGQGVQVKGFLKVGSKTLFVTAEGAPQLHEIRPLCVLDFYVHESCQRSGIGRLLFDRMLLEESTVPAKLAYDRPSPKFLAFLKKHFGLYQYVPQTNNFVVFYQYFEMSDRGGRNKQSNQVGGFGKGVESRIDIDAGPSRTRQGTAFSKREYLNPNSGGGVENDSMRLNGRRNNEGGRIFGRMDANARGGSDRQAAEELPRGGSPMAVDDGSCGQEQQRGAGPMHGRRSRRGSSDAEASLGQAEAVSIEESVPHAPTFGRRASTHAGAPKTQFLTTAPSAVGQPIPPSWTQVPAKNQDSLGRQGSTTLKRNDEARNAGAVARTVRTLHMSGKGAAEVLGADSGFLGEAYRDVYRQAVPRSRQRIQ